MSNRPPDQPPVVPSLEEMARRIHDKRAEVNRLLADYKPKREAADAAGALHTAAQDELRAMEKALAASKHQHAIAKALERMDIEYEGVLTYAKPRYGRQFDYYFLTAVSKDGTGLYLHTPEKSHRYQGKHWAIAFREDLVGNLAFGSYVDSYLRAIGLMEWQERGTGQFGAGSGGVKPKAPPAGGKWRWLKLQDQQVLEPEPEPAPATPITGDML